MTLWDEIRKLRRYGVVHCGLVASQFTCPEECARFFGLKHENVFELHTVDQTRRGLRTILRFHLAYEGTIMSEKEAERLTEAFAVASRLDEAETRCYGNVEWEFVEPHGKVTWGVSATDATFDTGVLVIARDRCTCLWIEDED